MIILRRMNRCYTEEEILETKEKLIENLDIKDLTKPHEDPPVPLMIPQNENVLGEIVMLVHSTTKLLQKIFKD